MSDNPYRARLEQLLAQAYQEQAKSITDGGFHTLHDYREHVGVLRGLQMAANLCEEAERSLNSNQDED